MGTSCLTIEKIPFISQEPRNTKTTSNQEAGQPQQAPLPRERLSPWAGRVSRHKWRQWVRKIFPKQSFLTYLPCPSRYQLVELDGNLEQNLLCFRRFLTMILGYARISTGSQKLDSEHEALTSISAERIFADTITVTTRSRPELDRMMQEIRDGDVVVVRNMTGSHGA